MDIATKKFLVVDDSQMIRVVVEKLLKELGAVKIDSAANGQEALALLQRSCSERSPYSLMTLDWEMPVMSGLELLKLIRADSELKRLSVLMISTQANPEHLKELAPLQPNGFVVKPFGPELLKERVLSLLELGSEA